MTCDECSQMVTSDGECQGKGIKGIDSAQVGTDKDYLGFHNCISSGSARNSGGECDVSLDFRLAKAGVVCA